MVVYAMIRYLKNWKALPCRAFVKQISYYYLCWTIFYHHFYFFNSIFCEEMPDCNMPGIPCTQVPSICSSLDETLIVLKDCVIQDKIPLMLQKHYQMYVVWQVIPYPHYFRLCWDFWYLAFAFRTDSAECLVQNIFLPLYAFHVGMNSVCCIYSRV